MKVKTGSFNPQAFLEVLSCLTFGALMLYLVVSGKYLSYVTPRMAPYLIFSAVVMGIFSVMGLRRLFRAQHVVRTAHCFVLAIPILFILLPHSPLSAADSSGGYVGGGALGGIKGSPSTALDESETSSPSNTVGTQAPSESITGGSEIPQFSLTGLDTVNKHITISNEEFYPWLLEIVTYLDKYVGYTVSMTGYVYRDPQYYAQNEFVPARLAMSCCAADLSPVGLLCIYEKASELTADSWVSVEGVIFKGQYEGQDEAQVHVSAIAPAQEVQGYIYPY